MNALQMVKKWIGEIVEIALLLVALGVTVEILFGTSSSIPFFGGVVANLTALIKSLGDNGLVGLIALAVIVWLFYRKNAVTQGHQ
ncbi:MAG: hypothetical protein WC962_06025 [Phycisphaerae bacterium]|jgi:hypothetical protein